MHNPQYDKLFLAFLWFTIKSPQDKQCLSSEDLTFQWITLALGTIERGYELF